MLTRGNKRNSQLSLNVMTRGYAGASGSQRVQTSRVTNIVGGVSSTVTSTSGNYAGPRG